MIAPQTTQATMANAATIQGMSLRSCGIISRVLQCGIVRSNPVKPERTLLL
jgi:hypothetical protein